MTGLVGRGGGRVGTAAPAAPGAAAPAAGCSASGSSSCSPGCCSATTRASSPGAGGHPAADFAVGTTLDRDHHQLGHARCAGRCARRRRARRQLGRRRTDPRRRRALRRRRRRRGVRPRTAVLVIGRLIVGVRRRGGLGGGAAVRRRDGAGAPPRSLRLDLPAGHHDRHLHRLRRRPGADQQRARGGRCSASRPFPACCWSWRCWPMPESPRWLIQRRRGATTPSGRHRPAASPTATSMLGSDEIERGHRRGRRQGVVARGVQQVHCAVR